MSSSVAAAAMLAMGGLGTVDTVTDAHGTGIVALIAVFACGYSMGWAPVTYILTTEISSRKLRDLTSRVGFTTNVCMK